MALITKISWIDIAGILIFTRVIYAALRRGLLNEFIKLLAVFSAGFLALQYYPLLLGGIFTRGPFFFRQSQLNVVSFFIIFIFVSFIFSWLRKGLVLLMPRDTYPRWEIASACLLGVVRASLLLSLLVFAVYLFPGHLSQDSRSLSFAIFKNIAPVAYFKTRVFYHKINPAALLNKEVVHYYEVTGHLPGGHTKRY